MNAGFEKGVIFVVSFGKDEPSALSKVTE